MPSFKMDNLMSVIPGLRTQDWMVSLDLKNAYFHVPILPQSTQFLRICILGICYQYRVLTLGLSTSPIIFAKMLATVMGFLRMGGIRLFPYLDDILMVAESKDMLLFHLNQTIEVLLQAGFVVNAKKSCLDPRQELTFLGATIRMNRNVIAIPMEKAHEIRDLALSFKMYQSYSATSWL
jgi:hypothetical protein